MFPHLMPMSILLLLVEPLDCSSVDKTGSDLFFLVVHDADIAPTGDESCPKRVDIVVDVLEQVPSSGLKKRKLVAALSSL